MVNKCAILGCKVVILAMYINHKNIFLGNGPALNYVFHTSKQESFSNMKILQCNCEIQISYHTKFIIFVIFKLLMGSWAWYLKFSNVIRMYDFFSRNLGIGWVLELGLLKFGDFFVLIWIQCIQGWTVTTRHGVTRKRNKKRLKHTVNLLRTNLQLIGVC